MLIQKLGRFDQIWSFWPFCEINDKLQKVIKKIVSTSKLLPAKHIVCSLSHKLALEKRLHWEKRGGHISFYITLGLKMTND